MKKWRRFLSLALTLIMVLGVLPANVLAEEVSEFLIEEPTLSVETVEALIKDLTVHVSCETCGSDKDRIFRVDFARFAEYNEESGWDLKVSDGKCTLTLSTEPYVNSFNKAYPGHKLIEEMPTYPVVLKWDAENGWTIPEKTIALEVICEDTDNHICEDKDDDGICDECKDIVCTHSKDNNGNCAVEGCKHTDAYCSKADVEAPAEAYDLTIKVYLDGAEVTGDDLADFPVTGAGSYEAGTEVDLKAACSESYAFNYWCNDVDSDIDFGYSLDAEKTIEMPAYDATIIANFMTVEEGGDEDDEEDPPVAAEKYDLKVRVLVKDYHHGYWKGFDTFGTGSYEADEMVKIGADAPKAPDGYKYRFVSWYNSKRNGDLDWMEPKSNFVNAAKEITYYVMPEHDAVVYAVYELVEVEPEIEWHVNLTKDHIAYIEGYGDNTVRPEDNITRAEIATIFYRLLTDRSRIAYETDNNPFSDVNKGDWFNKAVSTMANAGVMNGYPDGTFRPDEPITRAELAAVVACFVDWSYSGCDYRFHDVKVGHWAAEKIAIAYYFGWVKGYGDGSFRPDARITRAETVTLINRVLERAVEIDEMLPGMVTFDDCDPGDWFYEEIQEAANTHTFTRTHERVPGQNFRYESWTRLLD